MTDTKSQVQRDRQQLRDARAKGTLPLLGTFIKLSGPGWLQSALTLGGGSLGSSLYLGILAGVSMIWLQPFAMILGVIMLSAMSYVTLSTGERPLKAINQHLTPALGWAWVAATLLANVVWTFPQYSLCYAVCEQNLFPGLFQGDGALAPGPEGSMLGKWLVSLSILFVCTMVTWSYGSGGRGIAIYESILKVVVAVIVACFMGVVARIAFVGEGISFSAIVAGLVPRISHLFSPASTWDPLLNAIGSESARTYWSNAIVSQQRDVMLSAGAAAVGINMTFLMPLILLARGWDKEYRELTIFDLCTGMFIPFVLATGCIVIAAANQFHTRLPDGFEVTDTDVIAPAHFAGAYEKSLVNRQTTLADAEQTSKEEKLLAAALVTRDTQDLASSLKLLFARDGSASAGFFANIVFGLGVAGMTLSSISLMMLISGLVVCEILGIEPRGWIFRISCLISAVGILWPIIWTAESKAYLTIPAGVIGSMLLPIAYITFFLLMNHKKLMGDAMPKGLVRIVCNLLMGFATLAATAAGVSAVAKKVGEAITFWNG